MRGDRQAGRGRMLNQINRALDRNSDSALHRVRGQHGRINSHGRDHTRGRPHQNGGGRRQMNNGLPMGASQSMMNMSPQDQMHLMSLLEEQARMMAQLMPGFVSPAINPAFQPNNQQQQGRSLFERVERKGRPHGNFTNRAQHHGVSAKSPTDGDMDTKPDGAQDESNTDSVCRFNLRCTRKTAPLRTSHRLRRKALLWTWPIYAHTAPRAKTGNVQGAILLPLSSPHTRPRSSASSSPIVPTLTAPSNTPRCLCAATVPTALWKGANSPIFKHLVNSTHASTQTVLTSMRKARKVPFRTKFGLRIRTSPASARGNLSQMKMLLKS